MADKFLLRASVSPFLAPKTKTIGLFELPLLILRWRPVTPPVFPARQHVTLPLIAVWRNLKIWWLVLAKVQMKRSFEPHINTVPKIENSVDTKTPSLHEGASLSKSTRNRRKRIAWYFYSADATGTLYRPRPVSTPPVLVITKSPETVPNLLSSSSSNDQRSRQRQVLTQQGAYMDGMCQPCKVSVTSWLSLLDSCCTCRLNY